MARLLGSKLRKAAWAGAIVLALFTSDCAEHFEHILGHRTVPEWFTGFGRGQPEAVDVRVSAMRTAGQQAVVTLAVESRVRLTSRAVIDCALVDRHGGRHRTLRRTLHAAGVGGAIEPARSYPLDMEVWIGDLRGHRDGELWAGDLPLHLECAAARAR